MLTLIMKTITNNIMDTTQELHVFHNHLEFNYQSFYLDVILSHQYFNTLFNKFIN